MENPSVNISGLQLNNAEEATSYLAAIIESSYDAIVSKTIEGVITSWNKSAERIFGFKAEEAVGQHISLIIPSDRLTEEHEIIKNLLNGTRIENFETVRLHKDGSLIDISATISPIRNSDGKIIGASKIVRDISDRKKAEAQLLELSQRKDDFMAGVSHELRTPMNAVVGLTNILMQTNPLTPTQKHYLDTLKISADSLLGLINDILDFSKLEQNAIFLEEIPFDFYQLVEKVNQLAGLKAKEKNLDLRFSYDTALARNFIGDPLRMHQIVNNLVTNAVKFTGKGFVSVDVKMAAGSDDLVQGIILQVTDSGIGIADDKQGIIFEKFSQADNSIARRYGGSGLGLSICQTLIHKMGGTIQVDSKVGEGATFTVTMPLRKAPEVIPASQGLYDRSSEKRHRNVLIVEDHESNALVTSILLEEYGMTYDISPNGLDALRKFKKTNYDVILMDIQMPELDGLDTTRTIRKIENEETLHRTPIIAMTAHVMERDKDKCISAGMDDFLSKPFERHQLFKKIDTFMKPEQATTVA